jgi:3-dehydroquinate dehydratase
MRSISVVEGMILTEVNEQVNEERTEDIDRLQQRIDLLDRRMDNIDSMVTAVAERVMNQLVTINITCPHCNKDIEISLIGNQKPKR